MKLYERARVEKAGQIPGWSAARERGKRRSATSATVSARKASALVEEMRAHSINVTVLPMEQLRARAIAHYNGRQAERAGLRANESDSQEFLQRIEVNYVRHQLTNYDSALNALFRKIAKRAAATVIRQRIFDAIATNYPQLADECRRQAQGSRHSVSSPGADSSRAQPQAEASAPPPVPPPVGRGR
jgi:hypothetical protein